jgi:hypothetical protein
MEADEFMGLVVGRARKKRWEMLCSWSTVATTAAAPAVYAKQRPVGKLSQALAVLVVAPMTVRRARRASARAGLHGEERGVLRAPVKGEGVGMSLMLAPSAGLGLMIRGWDGVSDMAPLGSRAGDTRDGEGKRERASRHIKQTSWQE